MLFCIDLHWRKLYNNNVTSQRENASAPMRKLLQSANLSYLITTHVKVDLRCEIELGNIGFT